MSSMVRRFEVLLPLRFNDLITGIHGDDPAKLYADLCEVVDDVIAHFESQGRPLPAAKVKPMQDVV